MRDNVVESPSEEIDRPSLGLTSLSSCSHTTEGDGWAVKEQEREACPPAKGTVTFCGSSVMDGGLGTTGEGGNSVISIHTYSQTSLIRTHPFSMKLRVK